MPSGNEKRQPCSNCGGTGRKIMQTLSDTVRVSDGMEFAVQPSNAVAGKYSQFKSAMAAVLHAQKENSAGALQRLVKQVLEAIHELDDCRRNGDWDQTGWSQRDSDLWLAHIAARNAAHHFPDNLVVLRGGDSKSTQLEWALSSSTLGNLQSQRGVLEFNRLLLGRKVLPSLHSIDVALANTLE